MDINAVQHLGPSGYTLSTEEKAAMQISMLQRSREVGRNAAQSGASTHHPGLELHCWLSNSSFSHKPPFVFSMAFLVE